MRNIREEKMVDFRLFAADLGEAFPGRNPF